MLSLSKHAPPSFKNLRTLRNLNGAVMRIETERKVKRWREQRWILDQVIQTRGIDWDQGRTGKILRNCGPGVKDDLQEIARRIQKFADIPRQFARVAERREALG